MTYVSGFVKPEYKVYFALQFLYVISGVFDINWFYFGIEKFKLTVTRNTIIKVLTVVLILLLVKDKNDLSVYIVIMAGGVLLGQLAMWTQLGKYVHFVRTKWKDRPRKFCSPECRSRWNNTHPKPENWKTVRSKICPVCGREFPG